MDIAVLQDVGDHPAHGRRLLAALILPQRLAAGGATVTGGDDRHDGHGGGYRSGQTFGAQVDHGASANPYGSPLPSLVISRRMRDSVSVLSGMASPWP